MSHDLEEIKNEIINTISRVTGTSISDISIKKSLSEVGVDSFSLLEIGYELENKYDINLSEEDAVVDTLDELAKLIKSTLEKNG